MHFRHHWLSLLATGAIAVIRATTTRAFFAWKHSTSASHARARLSQWSICRKRRSRRLSILPWSLLCFLGTSLGFAGEACAADLSFLEPHGTIAAGQAHHFIAVTLLMMIVILPVLIGVPLIAWRYRYGNSAARYTPRWSHSKPLETVIWGVPVAVVIVLSFWLASDTTMLDPYRPLQSADRPLTVDVIGYDWKWLFVYPRLHVASLGELVFPEHTPLAMRLTTDTVMQSFFIPALGSQIYAMAAMQTKLNLIADSTGQFLGENTQYDGIGFQRQKFIARATTQQGFRDWLASIRANGIPLTAKVYSMLREHNTVPELHAALKASNMPPDVVFFRDVQPDLYWNVMLSFHGGPSSSQAMMTASNARARMMALMGMSRRSELDAVRKG
jgi:cytochrome o ubiquinol oxidase subunit II